MWHDKRRFVRHAFVFPILCNIPLRGKLQAPLEIAAEIIHGVCQTVVERALRLANPLHQYFLVDILKKWLLAFLAENAVAQTFPFYKYEEIGDKVNRLCIVTIKSFCWQCTKELLENAIEAT